MVAQTGCNGRKGSFRFIVLVTVCVHLSFIFASAITFNASFVPMQDLTTSPLYSSFVNGSLTNPYWASLDLPVGDRRFNWTPMMKALSYAGSFGGNVVCVQPLRFVIKKFGVHRTMSGVGFLGAIAVALTPFIISWSFPLFIVLRFINGLTFSPLFTTAGIVCNDWAPLTERGVFVAVLTGHVELGAMFALPIGAAVAGTIGWPYAFWLIAVILAVTSFLFAAVYRDSPSCHPRLRDEELNRISLGKTKSNASSGAPSIPYRSIFSSPVILAAWTAVIGTFFVSQFTITWSPIYLNNVLRYAPSMTGVISVAPLALQLIIKVSTGLMSDNIKSINEATKLRLFNTLALVGGAIFFALASAATPSPHWIDSILALAPIALLGFHAGGYPKCLLVVSRQHAPFVMSIVQMFACGTMFVGSFIIPAIAPYNTYEEWRKVFVMYAIVLMVTNTVFVVFATAQPAVWTEERPKINPIQITVR